MSKKFKERGIFVGFWIFLFVGLIIMMIGIILFARGLIVKNNCIKIKAEIVAIKTYTDDEDTTHNVFVSYEYNGLQYDYVQLNFYNSSMYKGKIITIYCDKDNPAKILGSSSSTWIPLLLVPFGGIFFAVGLVGVIIHNKKQKIQKQVKLNGQKIKCYVAEINPDKSYTVNGHYVNDIITCTPLGNSSQTKYYSNSFKRSNNIKLGDVLYVYFSPDNLDDYYVDLNSITGETYNIPSLEKGTNKSTYYTTCSYCGNKLLKNTNQCPHCGANIK